MHAVSRPFQVVVETSNSKRVRVYMVYRARNMVHCVQQLGRISLKKRPLNSVWMNQEIQRKIRLPRL